MNSSIIYKNVKLGKNVQIGDFVIIGLPPKGKKEGELETVIGDNSIIRSHTVIYAGNTIGKNFQTGHMVTIRELNEIGKNVSIGSHSNIEHHIQIEDNVRIHSNCFIPEYTILKKGAWIGPNVVMTNAMHPKTKYTRDCLNGPIVLEDAKIGANCTLLPNIKIGKNSLIAAGCVVTEDVAEDVLYINAKKIKPLTEYKCKICKQKVYSD